MASGGPPYYGRWPVGSVYEARLDNTWVSATPEQVTISATPGPSATVSTYSGYIVFKFTASGTLNVGAGVPGTGDVLLVKGGSAGVSGSPPFKGGAGGAGGSVAEKPATTITANTPIPVVIGGAATDSTFGPLSSTPGSAGGSGGTGAQSPATNATYGGDGPTNNYLTGSPQYYAGGGGGGGVPIYPGLAGGSGGGGAGGSVIPRPVPAGGPYGAAGTAGTANTGGGGGGGGSGVTSSGSGGAGGSGVVIVRFPTTYFKT